MKLIIIQDLMKKYIYNYFFLFENKKIKMKSQYQKILFTFIS